jgi:hypothetical protein
MTNMSPLLAMADILAAVSSPRRYSKTFGKISRVSTSLFVENRDGIDSGQLSGFLHECNRESGRL